MEDVAPIEGTADGEIVLSNEQAATSSFKKSKELLKIEKINDHKIGISKICDRFGYRADYLLQTGVTVDHVAY